MYSAIGVTFGAIISAVLGVYPLSTAMLISAGAWTVVLIEGYWK